MRIRKFLESWSSGSIVYKLDAKTGATSIMAGEPRQGVLIHDSPRTVPARNIFSYGARCGCLPSSMACMASVLKSSSNWSCASQRTTFATYLQSSLRRFSTMYLERPYRNAVYKNRSFKRSFTATSWMIQPSLHSNDLSQEGKSFRWQSLRVSTNIWLLLFATVAMSAISTTGA